jgi:hypothetical protein
MNILSYLVDEEPRVVSGILTTKHYTLFSYSLVDDTCYYLYAKELTSVTL